MIQLPMLYMLISFLIWLKTISEWWNGNEYHFRENITSVDKDEDGNRMGLTEDKISLHYLKHTDQLPQIDGPQNII